MAEWDRVRAAMLSFAMVTRVLQPVGVIPRCLHNGRDRLLGNVFDVGFVIRLALRRDIFHSFLSLPRVAHHVLHVPP